MLRAHFIAAVLFLMVTCTTVHATNIDPQEVVAFTSPCDLDVSQDGSIRTLSWSGVSGASTYKVGYRLGSGSIVTLAEVSSTSYEHSGWDSATCMEYLLVACDGTGNKICAAHEPNWGTNCPE